MGRTYAQQLEKAAKEAGVETVNTVFFNPQITDFSASVAKVTSTDPEAVFTLVNGNQIPQVWGQLQQQGIKPDRSTSTVWQWTRRSSMPPAPRPSART